MRPAEAGIAPAVGSVGDSDDTALAETINGLFKAEVPHRRGPTRSFLAIRYATLEWVDWFNTRRRNTSTLLGPIGNIPPAAAAANIRALWKLNAWPRSQPESAKRKSAGFCCQVPADPARRG